MYLNLWKETYEWERGTFLAKHVRKRERWTRRDRRKDFPQAEERIFLSRESQLQSRQARMLKLGMRIVLGLVIAAVAAAAVLFIVFYMVPFFHAEIKMESSEVESVSSQEPIEVPTYDSMGLPVYSDEITLFVINRDYPASADAYDAVIDYIRGAGHGGGGRSSRGNPCSRRSGNDGGSCQRRRFGPDLYGGVHFL